jgi:transglutaminase-like putative cysteine protease
MIRTCASLLSAAVLVVLPTLTVWLASSLVAFHGGPRELSLGLGVFLFPILPVLWESRATAAWKAKLARRRQLAGTPKRTFSGFTRLALRTLAICLVFTGAMVAKFPKVTFAALATRGDWFLPKGERGEPYRAITFALAHGLEGLHELANPNPYATKSDHEALAKIDPQPTTPTPVVPSGSSARWRPLTPEERAAREGTTPRPADPKPADPKPEDEGTFSVISWTDTGKATGVDPSISKLRDDAEGTKLEDDPKDTPPPPLKDALSSGETHWPWSAQISPIVSGMNHQDETSVAAVAQYIRSRESDPFRRVKALHDWVVTRLEYDHASIVPGQRKPQDANSVFQSRIGVCEGYARLLVELGRQTGDDIVYLSGDVREEFGDAAPVGHAWNAAKIDGRWYLIDATWDDPVDERKRSLGYRTDYLFIPPEVAIWNHFPDDSRWQLLGAPLTRGDFMRQPFARPGTAREGITMISPDRATIDATEALEIKLENPRRRFLMIEFKDATGAKHDCAVTHEAHVSARCPIPSSGELALFSNDTQYGTYAHVMSVAVKRR